jgi:hypothetical protein
VEKPAFQTVWPADSTAGEPVSRMLPTVFVVDGIVIIAELPRFRRPGRWLGHCGRQRIHVADSDPCDRHRRQGHGIERINKRSRGRHYARPRRASPIRAIKPSATASTTVTANIIAFRD